VNSVRVISAEESFETAERMFEGLLQTLVQEGIELDPTSDWESVASLVASLLSARGQRARDLLATEESAGRPVWEGAIITRDELWVEKI